MTTLADRLRASHTDLEKIARDVAASIRDDDRDVMRDDFAVLERSLLDHMSWEEMYVLPAYDKREPEIAAKIRAEHADFRAQLGEIGLAIDLHSVRADHFDELAARLKTHADREEAMYSTLDDQIPVENQESAGGRFDRLIALAKNLPLLGG
jgi:hemerythrin superfamily protein